MPESGLLILNADDWGRDRNTTDRILDCVLQRSLSSVSAMVFMEDSERAADIATGRGIDAGLHLNFTTPFSGPSAPQLLLEHQLKLSKYLQRHRLAQAVFHPGLVPSFEYVVTAQRDEFCRLYGSEPRRIDGHHHMHICLNVLLCRLLPGETIIRRNFSFVPGEKSLLNRTYRRMIDGLLARRHRLTDFFFSLPPLDQPDRLKKIFSLAHKFTVEVETHPVNHTEYRFLTQGDIFRSAGDLTIATCYSLSAPAANRK